MSDRPELFSVHLPRLPVSSVGAEIRPLDTVARIEPYGVIQFSEASRQIQVTEPENRNIEVRFQEHFFASHSPTLRPFSFLTQ